MPNAFIIQKWMTGKGGAEQGNHLERKLIYIESDT